MAKSDSPYTRTKAAMFRYELFRLNPEHFLFKEKVDKILLKIKLVSTMKNVWKGLFGVRNLTQNIAWDSGKCKFIDRIRDFTSTQEVGFTQNVTQDAVLGKKVAFRNIERQKLRTWDCREKRSGSAWSGSPIPDSAWTCFDLLLNCFRTCIKSSLEDLCVQTGALKDCLKETLPSIRVAAPSPWQSKNGEREGAVTRRLY